MKTAVVILNWNTKDYLRRFLPGLIASCEGADAEVIVADSTCVEILQLRGVSKAAETMSSAMPFFRLSATSTA